jgi:hypothetical protein
MLRQSDIAANLVVKVQAHANGVLLSSRVGMGSSSPYPMCSIPARVKQIVQRSVMDWLFIIVSATKPYSPARLPIRLTYGILAKIRDVGIPILALKRLQESHTKKMLGEDQKFSEDDQHHNETSVK